MSTPTDGELAAIINGPDPFGHLPRAAQLWLKPVKPVVPVLQATVNKPVGQFTVPELLAWGLTVAYVAGSVALAEAVLLNLVRSALLGR